MLKIWKKTILRLSLPVFLLFMQVSTPVCAIGIDGKLNILSSLYQPLRFSFPLIVKGENWSPDDINISIASEREYADLALPYPVGLGQIQYDIEDLHNGYMKVTAFSPSIIREPVITLLLYVEWPRGKIRYEFTLLMELPAEKSSPLPEQHKVHLLKKHIPAPEPEKTTKPDILVVEESAAESAISRPVQEKVEIVPLELSNSHDIVPLRTVKRDPLIVWDKPYKRYRIQNGDTLSTIAMTFRGTVKLPLHQYIAAIIAQNPQYFSAGINRIATGDILQIPNPNNVRSTSKNKAIEKTLKQQQKTFTYQVQYGDILSLLAQKLRGKQKIPLRKYIQQIIAANPGVLNKKGDNLKPGMVLNIPNLSYQKTSSHKSIVDLPAKKAEDKPEKKTIKPKPAEQLEQQKEAQKPKHSQQEDQGVYSLLSKPKAADQYWLALLGKNNSQSTITNSYPSVFSQPSVIIDTTNFRNQQIAFNDKQKRLAEQERLQQFKSLQSSYRKLTQQMVRQQQQYEQQNHKLKMWLIAVCVFFIAALFLLYQYLQSNMRKRIDWIIKMERSQYNAASLNQHADPDQTIKPYPRSTTTESVPPEDRKHPSEKKGFFNDLREKIGSIFAFRHQSQGVAEEAVAYDDVIMDHNLENTDLSFLDEHDHTDDIELDIEDDDEILEHASKDELDFTFDEQEEDQEIANDSADEAFQSSSYASTYKLNALELAEIKANQNAPDEKASPEDEHSEEFDLMSLTHEDEEVPDYIRLANEPVHQPVLPDDIVHLNDVDYEHLDYTDDVEGEIEKEIRRQIEKLEQNQPTQTASEKETDPLPVMDFDLTEEDSPAKKEQLSDLIAYVQQEIEEEERKLSQQQEKHQDNNEIQFTLVDKEPHDDKTDKEIVEIAATDLEEEEGETSETDILDDNNSHSKSQSPLEIKHESELSEEDEELVLTEQEEGILNQDDLDADDFMVEEQDVDEENIDNALSSLVVDHYEPPNPRPGPPVEEPGELIDFQSTIIDADLDFDDKDSPLEALEEQKLKTELNENVVSIHEIQPKKKKIKEEKKEEIADLVLDFFKEKDQN